MTQTDKNWSKMLKLHPKVNIFTRGNIVNLQQKRDARKWEIIFCINEIFRRLETVNKKVLR